MPPPAGANLASLGYQPMRRRSSAANVLDVTDIVNEAFKKVDINGDGKLSPAEISASLKELLSLKDPVNDADCICHAIDTDNDGFVSIDEFHDFIHPTILSHLADGKEIEVDRCLSDAMSKVLLEAKKERDNIIQAFMETEKAIADEGAMTASGKFLNKSWMHKLYDDFYNNPTADDAPTYRAARGDYLKMKLRELIQQEEKANNKKPEPKKNFNPWERRRSSAGDIDVEKKRNAFRQSIQAPDDEGIVAKFASSWLAKIEGGDTSRTTSKENCARG
jgi:hypothetical protein